MLDVLRRLAADPLVALAKRRSMEAMRIDAGDHVLEVGCGAGQDLPELAQRVGPQGRVIGVDTSPAALRRARALTGSLLQVTCLLAAADDLGFADGEFAAARLDRVMQHLPAPVQALREIALKVRQGGRVVALELDLITDQPRPSGPPQPADGLASVLPILMHKAGLVHIEHYVYEDDLPTDGHDDLVELTPARDFGRASRFIALRSTMVAGCVNTR